MLRSVDVEKVGVLADDLSECGFGVAAESVNAECRDEQRYAGISRYGYRRITNEPDPIICGRIKDREGRWFLDGCQWDTDVCLDDLA